MCSSRVLPGRCAHPLYCLAAGASALFTPPPAVAAVLKPCQSGAALSSDEDTGDEAYVRMHALMAEEERERLETQATGEKLKSV